MAPADPALDDVRAAVLLANHGLVAIGGSVGGALELASIVEHDASIMWRALSLGGPTEIPDEAVAPFRRVYESDRFGAWPRVTQP